MRTLTTAHRRIPLEKYARRSRFPEPRPNSWYSACLERSRDQLGRCHRWDLRASQSMQRVLLSPAIPGCRVRVLIVVGNENRLLLQISVVVGAVARGARTLRAVVVNDLAAIETVITAGSAGAHLFAATRTDPPDDYVVRALVAGEAKTSSWSELAFSNQYPLNALKKASPTGNRIRCQLRSAIRKAIACAKGIVTTLASTIKRRTCLSHFFVSTRSATETRTAPTTAARYNDQIEKG